MKANAKMSGEERRAAIIRAVRGVFAEKGSHGSTTRELAQAAGVSEALLFKHFPNKEALHAAMIQSCTRDKSEVFQRLMALEPSAATLVIHVHLMMAHFVGPAKPRHDDETVLVRLLQRSMMEDGDCARLLHQSLGAPIMAKIGRCIEAAIASDDATAGPAVSSVVAWFTQHLAMTVMFHLMPQRPIIDYGVSRPKLIEQMVWFALRGMGLKDEAIRRHYNRKALAPFALNGAPQKGAGDSLRNGKSRPLVRRRSVVSATV